MPGDIHPAERNNILILALETPEYPGHVRGAGEEATLTNFFCQPHRRHFTMINEEITVYMNA